MEITKFLRNNRAAIKTSILLFTITALVTLVAYLANTDLSPANNRAVVIDDQLDILITSSDPPVIRMENSKMSVVWGEYVDGTGSKEFSIRTLTDKQTGIDHVGTGSGNAHVAYGADTWGRDYITHQDANFKGSYYNRYSGDNVNDPADGGVLNYNGQFIVGVYKENSGHGFGRVIPVEAIDIIKLLLEPESRRGLEFFPYYQRTKPSSAWSSFLFISSDGAEGLLNYGKQIVDDPPHANIPGVTATSPDTTQVRNNEWKT